MVDYREALKKLESYLCPAFLGSSVGYGFRRTVNYLTKNDQLSKNTNPNADEIIRPVTVSLVYKAIESFLYWADRTIVNSKDPYVRHLLQNSVIGRLFINYPTSLHTKGAKLSTLLAFGSWEALETLLRQKMINTGLVFPTGLGTVEDLAMDATTILKLPEGTPVSQKFMETVEELEKMGYMGDNISRAARVYNRFNEAVILGAYDKLWMRNRLFSLKELGRLGKKPWMLRVYDTLYGDITNFIHVDSDFHYVVNPKGEITVGVRDKEKYPRPVHFAELYEAQQKK